MKNIAILLTCYNRKEKTISCLFNLYKTQNYKFDVYLVDDGSTDGTSQIVNEKFPDVHIIKGSGNLFWSRGMHLAWKTAAASYEYDYYIWINDDIFLYKDGIDELFSCSEIASNKAIITGIINNCENKDEILYGGYNQNGKLIIPNGLLQKVYCMNGNVVLIPKKVFNTLGNIDTIYHHDLGDGDYSLRAKKRSIEVFSTRKAIAAGTVNKICRLRKNNSTFIKRIKTLYSPLGSPPKINFYYRKKHFGVFNAILFFIFQHFLVIIPDQINSLLFKNKYK